MVLLTLLRWVFCRWGLRLANSPHLGARFQILCRGGLRRFSRLKFYADGGYVSQMGATFQILFRWGLRFRRWGRRSQLLCRWGLRIFVHTQMGAAFEILFRWGLRFRRWGRRSQLFADGGYGSLFTPSDPDGGGVQNSFFSIVMQIVDPRAPQARNCRMILSKQIIKFVVCQTDLFFKLKDSSSRIWCQFVCLIHRWSTASLGAVRQKTNFPVSA